MLKVNQRLVFCARQVRQKQDWTRNKKTSPTKQSNVIKNDMRSLNRAWNYHPRVMSQLRNDILLKPKFMNNVVLSPKIDLLSKKQEQTTPTDNELDNVSPKQLESLVTMIHSLPKHHQLQQVKVIEKEICRRIWNWDFGLTLRFMDLLYLSEYRVPMLYNSVLHMVDLKYKTVLNSPTHLIQLLFYISMYRNCPNSLMRQIENLVFEYSQDYSANELGFICHAFFACNASFQRYDLIKLISKRTVHELATKTLHPYMIQNICKALRHASFEDNDFYQALGDFVLKNSKVTTMQKLGVFKTFTSIGFIHENLCKNVLNSSSQMLNKNRDSFTFKVLVTLVSGSVHMQQICPQPVIERLQQAVEDEHKLLSAEYPEKFVEALVALVMAGQHPKRALDHALSPGFLESLIGRPLEQHYQILILREASIKSRKQPKIKSDFFTSIPADHLCDVRKQLVVRQGLRAVCSALCKLLGDDRCVKVHSIMKFSKIPDIEMHFNATNEAVAFSVVSPESTDDVHEDSAIHEDTASTDHSGVIDRLTCGVGIGSLQRAQPPSLYLRPTQNSTKDLRKCVVKVLSWNQYAFNCPLILGIHKYELELLQKKGYHVITIDPFRAAQLDSLSPAEQQELVKKLVLDRLLD